MNTSPQHNAATTSFFLGRCLRFGILSLNLNHMLHGFLLFSVGLFHQLFIKYVVYGCKVSKGCDEFKTVYRLLIFFCFFAGRLELSEWQNGSLPGACSLPTVLCCYTLGNIFNIKFRLLSFVLAGDGSQANRLSICFLKMEPCPCPVSNVFSYKTMSDADLGFWGIKWGQQREGLSLLPQLAAGQQLIYHLTSHPFYTPCARIAHLSRRQHPGPSAGCHDRWVWRKVV